MKKENLIYILHKTHCWNIDELEKYTAKGLENALITGLLDNNMMKKQQNINTTQKIPKILKNKVWDTFIGQEYGIGKCYCCNNNIDSKNFEAGHVIASSKNGQTILENLRPICGCCNKSIGTMNLEEFKKTYMSNMSNTNHKNHIIYKSLKCDLPILKHKSPTNSKLIMKNFNELVHNALLKNSLKI
jgi:hypothetical protein